MKISARVHNIQGKNDVSLQTDDNVHAIAIAPKSSGFGSSVNGGELLLLALATCYCNDIYREAAKRGIHITDVEVKVEGEFGKEGEPARNITYSAKLSGDAKESDILELMKQTDALAEIQNTLRIATPVTLNSIEIMRV